MRTGVIICLICLVTPVSPQSSVESLFFDLQFDEADKLLDAARQEEGPGYLYTYYDNYLFFLKTLVTGDDRSYEEYLRHSARNIRKMKELETDDPAWLNMLGLMFLQSSIINMDHDQRWKAIRNYYAAWRISESSRELYPDYDPGLKTQGILELIAGAVPGEYSWVLRWAGIKGSIESGRDRLRDYYWKCSAAQQPEAVLILTLSYLQFDSDYQAAFEFMESSLQGIEQGLLHRYLHALAAMKAGENDRAITILASLVEEAGSRNFYYVHLLLGEAKLNRLDQDAGRYLELFLQKHTGKNYIKMACHKLSWYYFLNDDMEEYLEMKARVLSSGQALVEADLQAELEARDTAALHPLLLVGRLCFDGGYYERGIQVLSKSPLSLFASVKAMTERDYRLARLYHRSGNLQEAVAYYHRVLTGAGDPMWVFYPNSMLQLGIICEETGQYQEAAGWYRSCLALEKEQYRRGIDLQAESGLRRIEPYLGE